MDMHGWKGKWFLCWTSLEASAVFKARKNLVDHEHRELLKKGLQAEQKEVSSLLRIPRHLSIMFSSSAYNCCLFSLRTFPFKGSPLKEE